MDPYKTNRLNASLQRTLAELLATEVKDPRVGLVTINEVELNRDHSVAKVYCSVLGGEEERQASLTGLKKARGFLQGKVTQILRLRGAPELRFYYDDSLDRSFGIEGVLSDLEARGVFRSEIERLRLLTLDDLVPPDDLIVRLREADSVWVVPHANPDPDAVGSALALAEALRALDKDVTVFRFPDPPVGLTWLPGWDACVAVDQAEVELQEAAPDLVVLVDCHRTDRTGELQEVLDRIPVVWCVDHHMISGRRAPAPGWVEARSESTCTLVHQVIAALPIGGPDSLTADMATNLFAGLVGDTGGFRFANTLPLSFDLARKLALRGVDTAEVTHQVLHRRRRAALALLQSVLVTCEYHLEGRIAVARTSTEMLKQTGASLAETEGFVNVLTTVDGVAYAAFIKETEPDVWRVSLRSRGEAEVQSVASALGGGGHRQAAGCTLEGPAAAVTEQVVMALEAAARSRESV